MDSYTALLEKTRVPQPSLQKLAVSSIFSKLRTAPARLDPESDPGRDAITQCLTSSSPAVVDQSVREMCRLVSDSKLDLSRGLLELQSALEGSDPNFVPLFVKSIGFLVRLGFQRNRGLWRFDSTENHPFVKIVSCRNEGHPELVRQVLVFIERSRNLGVGLVGPCEFLRSLLNLVILHVQFPDSSLFMFARDLVSSLASYCCSSLDNGVPVLKLLMGCIKLLPHKNANELRSSYFFMECIVDAYIAVLRYFSRTISMVSETQLLGAELSDSILSQLTYPHGSFSGCERIIELLKRLYLVQKDLTLQYIPKLSSSLLSLFVILIQSDFEHEQLSSLKVLNFLLKWKYEDVKEIPCALTEELLLMFPVIKLISTTASVSVKRAATDLLVMVEKILIQLLGEATIDLSSKPLVQSISSPGCIVYRLLRHLWIQDQFSLPTTFFENFASSCKADVKEMHMVLEPWPSQIKEYSSWIVNRRRLSLPLSQPQETFFEEMPMLLSAITCVLVIHPSLAHIAMDLLAAIGTMDPKQGVPFLLVTLFYSNVFTRMDLDCNMLIKLLSVLPLLASHSAMIPLVIRTILPMLHKDGNGVLYEIGTRLLCQTWAVNDRAFGNLEAIISPARFTEFKSERNICISLAASVRDVCRKHPDRGVDLILSVSACIENQDTTIQSLGFQSLAHLCEADVVDFYTAWDVIRKDVPDYSRDPVIAHSISLLLRWGAMDAEAYPEASKDVLQLLWSICSSGNISHEAQWAKARASAFEALAQFEVSHVQRMIPDFKLENANLLFSEIQTDVLKAVEEFEVKIIMHEHITRRRLVKEKRVMTNKIEKLLNILPQVLFPSGKKINAGQLPGAALFFPDFISRNMHNQGPIRAFHDINAVYQHAVVEIASSLQLSRNIFMALFCLQSWKSFMRQWMRAIISSQDAKATSTGIDKTSKAANDILKTLVQLSEESIPRSAENIALAVGALCEVLPSSAHTIKSTASKFLLNWLFHYGHEYHQWSAAISLGLISISLHATDRKQKFDNIAGLIEVFQASKSSLVKGACGVGLGFSCQGLLTRNQDIDDGYVKKENFRMELDLLGKIIKALLSVTSQFSEASYDILQGLSAYFPEGIGVVKTEISSVFEEFEDLEEDIWGVAGVVLGLGNSVGAIYRAGAHELMLKIKDLLISWIPQTDSLALSSSFSYEGPQRALSMGACLAVPAVVIFCRKMEMMNDIQLDDLVNGYNELISELLNVRMSGACHHTFLMVSCIGAGNLLACILDEGVHPVKFECVDDFLQLCRKCFSLPNSAIIHLGGMLGIVNAVGAGAGLLFHGHSSTPFKSDYELKDTSYILGPLLSCTIYQPNLTTLIQELFLIAQNSDDPQLQQHATWAVSFLRDVLWSKESTFSSSVQTDVNDSKLVSQSFTEDNLVVKLSGWLVQLNYSEATVERICTIKTVLRCMSRAPRLPAVDWGSVILRCMRCEAQVYESFAPNSAPKKETLREECLKFSIAHASKFSPLLTFLDELSDLSRFRMLELNLQSCLLFHLSGLVKVFSGSRLEKLFNDIAVFFTSESRYQSYSSEERSHLRISCWKGLCRCLDEVSLGTLGYLSIVEKCMEVLFPLLPKYDSGVGDQLNSAEEWYQVVQCFAKTQGDWLLGFLQVPLAGPVEGDEQFNKIYMKIIAKAKLVKIGSISLTELGKLKAYILNQRLDGVWDVLVEVVGAVLSAEGRVIRQWLVNAVEISCISCYPSSALQFVGLLSGACCKYMPLLMLDQSAILSDLPVTLTSLLAQPAWEVVAESIVTNLWASTERLYDWAKNASSTQTIDESERDQACFMLKVMHCACVTLKEYLPLQKQLKLANMDVS